MIPAPPSGPLSAQHQLEGSKVIAYACLSAGEIVLAEVPGALRHDTNDALPVVVLGQVELNVATNPGQHQGQNRHPAEPLAAPAAAAVKNL